MQDVRTQAIEIIQQMPTDKVYYVMDILKGIKGLYALESYEEKSKTEAKAAYEGLAIYRDKVPSGIDEKEELASARYEKYENPGRY